LVPLFELQTIALLRERFMTSHSQFLVLFLPPSLTFNGLVFRPARSSGSFKKVFCPPACPMFRARATFLPCEAKDKFLSLRCCPRNGGSFPPTLSGPRSEASLERFLRAFCARLFPFSVTYFPPITYLLVGVDFLFSSPRSSTFPCWTVEKLVT